MIPWLADWVAAERGAAPASAAPRRLTTRTTRIARGRTKRRMISSSYYRCVSLRNRTPKPPYRRDDKTCPGSNAGPYEHTQPITAWSRTWRTRKLGDGQSGYRGAFSVGTILAQHR